MNDAETIAVLRKQHIDAVNRADADGMASVASSDIVVMPPNLPAFEGKEAVRSWWEEILETARSHFAFIPTELEIAGEWAFDRFAWTVEATPTGGGETAHDNGDCVWIWRKEPDGTWLLARAIWNSDNEATGN